MYFKKIIIQSPSFFRTSVFLMTFTMLLGCTFNSGMEVIDRDFGKSVRLMEQGQIYDMNAAMNPSPNGPEGISGAKSLADLYQLERPVTAEKQLLNLIKAKRFEIGE